MTDERSHLVAGDGGWLPGKALPLGSMSHSWSTRGTRFRRVWLARTTLRCIGGKAGEVQAVSSAERR